jgi:hypothetical protein
MNDSNIMQSMRRADANEECRQVRQDLPRELLGELHENCTRTARPFSSNMSATAAAVWEHTSPSRQPRTWPELMLAKRCAAADFHARITPTAMTLAIRIRNADF